MMHGPKRIGRSVLVAAVMLGGCTTVHSELGLLRPNAEALGVKMLRPGVRARECRSSVLGIPVRGGARASLVSRIFGLDPEADLLLDARLTTETTVTGVYNRTCIELAGDLAREISVVTLPSVGPGHDHGH